MTHKKLQYGRRKNSNADDFEPALHHDHKSALSMQQNQDTVVYKPSLFSNILWVLVGVFFLSLNLVAGEDDPTIFGDVMAWMGGLLIAYSCYSLISSKPRIILSPQGITYQELGLNQFFSWHEVGAFSLSIQYINKKTSRYICAFTDINFDAILSLGEGITADHYNAEIMIEITRLKVGRSDQSGYKFVDEINQWRALYGSPEDNSAHLSASEKQAIVDRLRSKGRNLRLFLIIAIISMSLVAVILGLRT